MAAETNGGTPENKPKDLQKEVERLSTENMLLRLRAEFEQLLHDDREKQAKAFKEHKSDVKREISERLLRTGLLGLIVIGFAWWSTFQPLRQAVKERLDREFASKNIKALILDAATRAAQSQSKEMIQGTLRPAIDQAKEGIRQDSNNMRLFEKGLRKESRQSINRLQVELKQEHEQQRRSMGSLREEYTKDLGRLQAAVDYEGRLRDIQLQKDSAVEGSFSAFERLAEYRSHDQGLVTEAQVALMAVKGFYIVGTRTKGVHIWLKNPDGSNGAEDENIPASSLIAQFLFGQPRWELRAKAAQLLGGKRQAGVAEALLRSMQTDPNLWVRRESLRSFEQLTGFAEQDVFDFKRAAQWWQKNKDRYLKAVRK